LSRISEPSTPLKMRTCGPPSGPAPVMMSGTPSPLTSATATRAPPRKLFGDGMVDIHLAGATAVGAGHQNARPWDEFISTDVGMPSFWPIDAALIAERDAVRPRIDGRAAEEKGVGEGRAAVVLEGPELGIGVVEVACIRQERRAAVVARQVVVIVH